MRDFREDHLRLTEKYIVDKNVIHSRHGGDRVLQWANKVMRDSDRAIRRILRLCDFRLNEDNTMRRVRRAYKVKGKNKKFSSKPVFKHGDKVPRNKRHDIQLDKVNGNNY